jgi:3-keto-disaccharide hydrolase
LSTKPRMVLALMICASMALGSCVRAPVEEVEESWISLFNGTDLTGWTPKFAGFEPGVNFRNTFQVENGILKVAYDEYDRFNGEFGHLFYNDRLSHYRLRVEYRFTGEQTPGGPEWGYRNSGVMIHGQTPDSMTLDQRFPVSIEVQLLGGDGEKDRPTANLCTPGTHVEMGEDLITRHCTNSVSATFHGDVWVHVEIEVRGGRIIRHLVNGETVIEYTNPQLDGGDPDAQTLMEAGAETMLTGGTISIQAESHPLEFRRIEILELRKK